MESLQKGGIIGPNPVLTASDALNNAEVIAPLEMLKELVNTGFEPKSKVEINIDEIAGMVAQDPRITAHPQTVLDVLKVGLEKTAEAAKKNRVEFFHFGVFQFRKREAFTTRLNGISYEIPAAYVLKFKASDHQEFPIETEQPQASDEDEDQ
jgi:nucleoid DNA-binding protein